MGKEGRTHQLFDKMPTRKPTGNAQQQTPLRRSSRLLQLSKSRESQESSPRKSKSGSNGVRSVSLPRVSTSTLINLEEKSHEACAGKVSKESRKTSNDLLDCSNQTIASGRSPRLSIRDDGFSSLRRSPRFWNKRKDNNIVQYGRTDSSRKVSERILDKAVKNKYRDSWAFSDGEKDEVCENSSEKIGVKSKRRTRRSCLGTANESETAKVGPNSGQNRGSSVIGSVSESINEEINGRKGEWGPNFSNLNVGKRKWTIIVGLKALTAEERRQGRVASRGNKEIETKLKRKCTEEANGVVQGWTKDQEVALQRAYFAAKPTPHFWKKVSKLVPGKSAQDCFDKIHSDLITPPQPRTRSRAIRMNSSPIDKFSLSASKLLESTEPEKKRSRCNKQKSHAAQKTVRKLLQRHYNVNQDCEADLFSILEPDIDPSTHVLPDAMLSTPQHLQEKQGFIHKYHETSSAGSKKNLPSFRSSCTTALVSPPVLKQVKNKAFHEKYIDRLCSREAKRKAVSVQTKKSFSRKENMRPNHIQNIDVVRAAKQALVSDARDVIDRFQHLQKDTMGDSSDLDDNGGASSDDNDGDSEI